MAPETPREPREVEIDGARYIVGTLPPRRAYKLLNRILRVAGPGVLQLVATGGSKLGDLDVSALGSVARSVFAQLTPEEQDAIMAEALAPVEVVEGDKKAPVMKVFDSHFAGRLPAIAKLTWEALKANFADFQPALAELDGKAGAKSGSEESTTS